MGEINGPNKLMQKVISNNSTMHSIINLTCKTKFPGFFEDYANGIFTTCALVALSRIITNTSLPSVAKSLRT